MKFVYILPLFLIALAACGDQAADDNTVQSSNEQMQSAGNGASANDTLTNKLVSTKDYQEFYINGALKIEGDYDADKKRHGLWKSYYENGLKWSESFYSHGVKSGHSITFYPTGKVRYVGEYKDDRKIGRWQFYDEEGKLSSEENYSE